MISPSKFGFIGTFSCSCCRIPKAETINHIFVESDGALAAWNVFGNSFGVPFVGDLRQNLIKWWLTKSNNKILEFIMQCLLSIICWEIWKKRCAGRYGEGSSSIQRLIYQIQSYMSTLITSNFANFPKFNNWKHLCFILEKIKPALNVIPVKWRKPPDGYLKLNTDGCSKGNSSLVGGGGILREQ